MSVESRSVVGEGGEDAVRPIAAGGVSDGEEWAPVVAHSVMKVESWELIVDGLI